MASRIASGESKRPTSHHHAAQGPWQQHQYFQQPQTQNANVVHGSLARSGSGRKPPPPVLALPQHSQAAHSGQSIHASLARSASGRNGPVNPAPVVAQKPLPIAPGQQRQQPFPPQNSGLSPQMRSLDVKPPAGNSPASSTSGTLANTPSSTSNASIPRRTVSRNPSSGHVGGFSEPPPPTDSVSPRSYEGHHHISQNQHNYNPHNNNGPVPQQSRQAPHHHQQHHGPDHSHHGGHQQIRTNFAATPSPAPSPAVPATPVPGQSMFGLDDPPETASLMLTKGYSHEFPAKNSRNHGVEAAGSKPKKKEWWEPRGTPTMPTLEGGVPGLSAETLEILAPTQPHDTSNDHKNGSGSEYAGSMRSPGIPGRRSSVSNSFADRSGGFAETSDFGAPPKPRSDSVDESVPFHFPGGGMVGAEGFGLLPQPRDIPPRGPSRLASNAFLPEAGGPTVAVQEPFTAHVPTIPRDIQHDIPLPIQAQPFLFPAQTIAREPTPVYGQQQQQQPPSQLHPTITRRKSSFGVNEGFGPIGSIISRDQPPASEYYGQNGGGTLNRDPFANPVHRPVTPSSSYTYPENVSVDFVAPGPRNLSLRKKLFNWSGVITGTNTTKQTRPPSRQRDIESNLGPSSPTHAAAEETLPRWNENAQPGYSMQQPPPQPFGGAMLDRGNLETLTRQHANISPPTPSKIDRYGNIARLQRSQSTEPMADPYYPAQPPYNPTFNENQNFSSFGTTGEPWSHHPAIRDPSSPLAPGAQQQRPSTPQRSQPQWSSTLGRAGSEPEQMHQRSASLHYRTGSGVNATTPEAPNSWTQPPVPTVDESSMQRAQRAPPVPQQTVPSQPITKPAQSLDVPTGTLNHSSSQGSMRLYAPAEYQQPQIPHAAPNPPPELGAVTRETAQNIPTLPQADVASDMRCPLCNQTADRPVRMASCCSGIACYNCYWRWAAHSRLCPFCRTVLSGITSVAASKAANAQVVDMQLVQCAANGCGWVGARKNLKEHLSECAFRQGNVSSVKIITEGEEKGDEISEGEVSDLEEGEEREGKEQSGGGANEKSAYGMPRRRSHRSLVVPVNSATRQRVMFRRLSVSSAGGNMSDVPLSRASSRQSSTTSPIAEEPDVTYVDNSGNQGPFGHPIDITQLRFRDIVGDCSDTNSDFDSHVAATGGSVTSNGLDTNAVRWSATSSIGESSPSISSQRLPTRSPYSGVNQPPWIIHQPRPSASRMLAKARVPTRSAMSAKSKNDPSGSLGRPSPSSTTPSGSLGRPSPSSTTPTTSPSSQPQGSLGAFGTWMSSNGLSSAMPAPGSRRRSRRSFTGSSASRSRSATPTHLEDEEWAVDLDHDRGNSGPGGWGHSDRRVGGPPQGARDILLPPLRPLSPLMPELDVL
ncbi:hypothetical protein BJ742DRAFT_175823 [Cladochytrium replicatum]|nr:hypothetical protein BJ742DRAFT_175823 [Cladochytrium replicatum]